MRQIFTAFAFLAVLITPTILAAHAAEMTFRHKRRSRLPKGFIRLFETPTK